MNGGHHVLLKSRRLRTRCLVRTRAGKKLDSGNEIERRIGTLKKLIPNGESKGVDGLLKETSAYILSLQMRVQVMQIMVKVIAGSNDQ